MERIFQWCLRCYFKYYFSINQVQDVFQLQLLLKLVLCTKWFVKIKIKIDSYTSFTFILIFFSKLVNY